MHRLPRSLLYPLMALLPALAVLAGFSSAASASTPTSQAASAAALARTAIKQLAIGQHANDQRVPGTQRIKGLTDVQSDNWSGYADTGSGFSKITGAWTEPTVSCTSSTTSLVAFWVGIDGYTSDSVEQDGTVVECYERTEYEYTWWEMYPTNDIQVVGESLKAGDSITSSVVRSGTSYTLKVTDSTHTANSFTTTQTCSNCANSSVEWIAEAPSGSSGPYPLSDFSPWTEKSATVTEGSTSGVISSFPDVQITMADSSGNIQAQPGALNGSGNGFGVTWKRST